MKRTFFVSAVCGVVAGYLGYLAYVGIGKLLTNTQNLLTDQNNIKSNRFRKVEDFETSLGGYASL